MIFLLLFVHGFSFPPYIFNVWVDGERKMIFEIPDAHDTFSHLQCQDSPAAGAFWSASP